MTEYYKTKLEEALQYQDFVMEVLMKEHGLIISCFSSKKYQYAKGESLQGFEIKHDQKLETTGNLYIETQERTSIHNDYVASGIYRNDNSWIYIIGNYHKIFIFGKRHLRTVFERGILNGIPIEEKEIGRHTSKGFLVPAIYAEEKLAINVIRIS